MAVTSIPLSSITIFRQPSAPVKWTKLTTNDDCALRVTNGVIGTGGTRGMSTLPTSTTITIGGSYTITGATVNPSTGSIGPHSHALAKAPNSVPGSPNILSSVNIYFNGTGPYKGYGGSLAYTNYSGFTGILGGVAGGTGTHNHTVSSSYGLPMGPYSIGSTSNWTLAYKDVIVCRKDIL